VNEGADPHTPMTAPPDGAARRDSGPGTSTAFLAGGGEMGRRIAELDGAATPLGPLASWSTTLRTAVGICVTSRHPMVIWWGEQLMLLYNDAWIPILGPAKHPALGRPGREVWPEMWHIIGRQLTGVRETGEATWSDDQLLPADRFGYLEEAYFTYSYSPIRTDDGRVAGVFTAVTETTSRVLGERRLRTLRELGDIAQAADVGQACSRTLAALATNRADIPFAAVYLLAPDGASARLMATEGLVRAALPETLPPAGPVGRSIWRAATDGRTVASSGLASRLPGLAGPGHNRVGDADVDTAWAVPLTGAGSARPFGVLVLGISPYRALDARYRSFLDLAADQVSTALTDVQAHEAERRRIDALAELDRAKTEFFTGVSHELRTPLTLITGPAQDGLADRGSPLPPAQRDRMELIRRNSGRLRRLVDTMLDFARLEGGRLVADRSPVDLAHLTRGIAGTFAPAAERAGLGFVLDCPDLPSGVLVDPDMWEKIVLNLLSNAVKYTLDGAVTVRLRQGADGATELVVSDTGVGIPAADLPRVFDRFHRVRGTRARSAEGTGIGLALVAELVALHDGEVGVTSSPGAGSVFTVRLPAAARTDLPVTGARTSSSVGLFLDEALSWVRPPEGPDAGPTASGRIDTGTTAGATVLVAEDNPDLRWYVAGLLRPHYAVHEAPDGVTALEVARQHPVDLVLADVMMPGLDGFGLLAALRAHPTTAGLPVVLLSARAGEEAAIEGLRAGADDYLTKPFSSHDLLARVRSNLELARLRSHEARWRTAMVDALQDGFTVIDVASAAIVEINPATTDLLGLRPEHLPCGPPYPIFPTAEEDAAELALLQAAYDTAMGEDHGEVVVPLRHVDTRERVWVSASYSALPARDGQGALVVATMRDVTAQRRTAERDALLAEVGALLAEPLSVLARLDRFARLLAGALAELVVVSLRGPDGRLSPVAAAHAADPGLAADRLRRAPYDPPAELTRRHRAGPGSAATGVPDPLVVPLVVAGRLLGSVELAGRAAAGLGADGALAEELGNRIAGAVDAARPPPPAPPPPPPGSRPSPRRWPRPAPWPPRRARWRPVCATRSPPARSRSTRPFPTGAPCAWSATPAPAHRRRWCAWTPPPRSRAPCWPPKRCGRRTRRPGWPASPPRRPPTARRPRSRCSAATPRSASSSPPSTPPGSSPPTNAPSRRRWPGWPPLPSNGRRWPTSAGDWRRPCSVRCSLRRFRTSTGSRSPPATCPRCGSCRRAGTGSTSSLWRAAGSRSWWATWSARGRPPPR
jgi:PAS domain S-box-containing protein